ncbi:hypothetical protein NMG60_11007772 [Bertholletia excelsa]
MATSPKHTANICIRSVSLPIRSHPSIVRVEQELNKIKTWETSPSHTCNALARLEELYMCMDEHLNSATTQQVLFFNQHEKCVDELLEESLKFIDVCGIARDLMLQFKEHARALQSALRRRKGDSSIETTIARYVCFRRKAKKDAKRLTGSVKQIDKRLDASLLLGRDHHFYSVIRVLKEVIKVSTCVFCSILLFVSISSLKPNSVASRLLHRGRVASEDRVVANEVERVDTALHGLLKCRSSEGEGMQIAQRGLEGLERRSEAFESGLESLFRSLIRTRISLLNIVSFCY